MDRGILASPECMPGLWAQYLLDNAATVAEAVTLLNDVQIVMIETHGHKATVHLAIEDADGDSAILEYLNGKLAVHHGRQYQIMTNDPTYDEQLALLKKQDYSKPSMDLPIPGNVNAIDRFQRATYYKAVLQEPKNEREAVAGVLAIARQCLCPVRCAISRFLGLQHRVPDGYEPYQQALLLRADQPAECYLG